MRAPWKGWSRTDVLALGALVVALLSLPVGLFVGLYPDRTRSVLERSISGTVFFPIPLWSVVVLVAGTVLVMSRRRREASSLPLLSTDPATPRIRTSGPTPPPPVDGDEVTVLRMLASGPLETRTVVERSQSKWGLEKFKMIITRLRKKNLIVVRRQDWATNRLETIELSEEGRELMHSRGELK
jgi:hypothetical protein